jgi:hypothetical protein
MEVQLSTAIAIATAVFTAGGAWFTVRSSTQRLEAQRDKDTTVAEQQREKLEARVAERLKEYGEKKDDQARRIGRVEERVSKLEGRSSMLDDIAAAIVPQQRRRTNAGGVPRVTTADEDET